MSSLKHIGILAHSADGAACCFLEAIRESARRLGAHRHPEITLSVLPMGAVLEAWERTDLVGINTFLTKTARRLADAGCDFFICPDNTAHIALDAAAEQYPIPGLHIADIVAQRARAEGGRCVALLGTRWTMEGPAYRDAFARAGIDFAIPNEHERTLIDGVIFKELCQGILSDDSRNGFIKIIDGMRRRGCDSVALACTEIPLLITPDVSPLPTLDSTRLLAHAAVDVAIGKRPLPTWLGGASAMEAPVLRISDKG